jgi:Zn-finger nucleic acid-binding protein
MRTASRLTTGSLPTTVALCTAPASTATRSPRQSWGERFSRSSDRSWSAARQTAIKVFKEIFDRILSHPTGSPVAPRAQHVCPLCGKALMKRPLPDELGALEQCGPCGGMWLRHETLRAILETELDRILPYLSSHHPDRDHRYEDGGASRNCPGCGKPMETFRFALHSGVWIDACPDDHGVWLDAGELERLIDYEHYLQHVPLDVRARLVHAFAGVVDPTWREHVKARSRNAAN